MAHFAEHLQFEQAQIIKEKLLLFEDYQGKSTVVSSSIHDVDVFAIAEDEKEAFVNYLKVVNGAIIHTYNITLTKNLNDAPDTLLAFAIRELREKFASQTEEIIVPYPVALPEANLIITVPKIGDKKKLLELSDKNVKYNLLQSKKREAGQTNRQSTSS